MKKKVRKTVAIIALVIVVLAAAAVLYLTVREYRPEAVEKLEPSEGTGELKAGESFAILTYNTGYADLDKEEDFFMDGGKKVMPDSREVVEHNLEGISSILEEQNADIYFLQGVDLDSKRSYHAI